MKPSKIIDIKKIFLKRNTTFKKSQKKGGKINENKKVNIKRKSSKTVKSPKFKNRIKVNNKKEPPKKAKSIIKRSSERIIHKRNINNNILLNVQVIKPEKKKRNTMKNMKNNGRKKTIKKNDKEKLRNNLKKFYLFRL